MNDILQVFARFELIQPEFRVNLIEISPHLSQLQKSKLCHDSTEEDQQEMPQRVEHLHYQAAQSRFKCPIYWYRQLADVPRSFTLYIAHEFFDALPIHKLVKKDNGWREILIDLDPSDQTLRYVISRDRTPACTFVMVNNDTYQYLTQNMLLN